MSLFVNMKQISYSGGVPRVCVRWGSPFAKQDLTRRNLQYDFPAKEVPPRVDIAAKNQTFRPKSSLRVAFVTQVRICSTQGPLWIDFVMVSLMRRRAVAKCFRNTWVILACKSLSETARLLLHVSEHLHAALDSQVAFAMLAPVNTSVETLVNTPNMFMNTPLDTLVTTPANTSVNTSVHRT